MRNLLRTMALALILPLGGCLGSGAGAHEYLPLLDAVAVADMGDADNPAGVAFFDWSRGKCIIVVGGKVRLGAYTGGTDSPVVVNGVVLAKSYSAATVVLLDLAEGGLGRTEIEIDASIPLEWVPYVNRIPPAILAGLHQKGILTFPTEPGAEQ